MNRGKDKAAEFHTATVTFRFSRSALNFVTCMKDKIVLHNNNHSRFLIVIIFIL